MNREGHVGLSNEKVNEAGSGEFLGRLSYLKVSQQSAFFVIHVYSNTFDYSPYLQRSNVRGKDRRENFLERLGFAFCDSCNIMPNGRCYYRVVQEVDRNGEFSPNFMQHQLRIDTVHSAFKQFMTNLKAIYDEMLKVDKMLLEAGIELPWSNLKPQAIIYGQGEKVYEKGQVYDFYKDIRDITDQAKSEVFLIDAYADEEILNLYLEKIPAGIKIRILTNTPKGNFVTVAQKFKMNPGVNFEVRTSKDCHDRLFFIDESCWVTGQSLKDAGKKPTYLVKIESHQLFRKVFEDLWTLAQPLV
jgi:hypothetical protein